MDPASTEDEVTSGSADELDTVALCSTDEFVNVTSASTGDGVALTPVAVSYTHLTLPTIYSV